MNAGAVAASYLVFDEFHLFDPVSTLPTTLQMLRMLRGVAPFLLMTATFSSDLLHGLAEALDAVVVPECEADLLAMRALPSQQKTRRYHAAKEPLTADAVLAQPKERVLVVCNVVARAQRLFEALRDHPDRGDRQVLLLHSRFLQEDRQRLEEEIRREFARDWDGSGSWIVVATQVVEVGLDITCDALHTELAPANSVLQRAGRCARYQGEQGDVFVYRQTLDADGEWLDLQESVLPYRELGAEIAETWNQFRSIDGDSLDFATEQAIISSVHGPRDRATIEGLTATQEMHRRQMTAVMNGQRSGSAGNLIRAVSSRLVVVHDDPDAVLERPFAYEAFSLHPCTVFGLVKNWLEREEELGWDDWAVRALFDLGDQGESGETAYRWVPVQEQSDVAGSALVLVHPDLAGYDRELGFVPLRGTGYCSKASTQTSEGAVARFGYVLETYGEHVRLVYNAFRQKTWPELHRAASRLELEFGWPAASVERAAHLVVLFHDVGKLGTGWQGWVRNYQKQIGQPAPAGCYAHTDFDPSNPIHVEQQQALGRRPPHAVEGAVAVAPILLAAVDECEPVCKAAFSAIARHHGAFATSYRPYQLERGARDAIAATVEMLPGGLGDSVCTRALLASEDPAQTGITDLLVDPAKDGEFLAYMLLARALRRADQAGTQEGSHEP